MTQRAARFACSHLIENQRRQEARQALHGGERSHCLPLLGVANVF